MSKKFEKKFYLLLIAIFIFSSLFGQISFAKTHSENQSTDKLASKANVEKYEKGEIIVKYKAKNRGNIDTTREKVRNNIKNRFAKDNSFTPAIKKKFGDNIEVITVNPNENIKELCNKLNEDYDIEYAQPNYIYTLDSIPQDPKFSEQWALKNTLTGIDINASKAWDITSGSNTTIVAVLDTGVDTNHPDLINNIFTNTGEIPNNNIDDDGNNLIDDVKGWDFLNNDNTVYDGDQTNGYHGTHIAGIIAASMNTIGSVGVAPNVKILPVKILNTTLNTSCIISGINYAKSMGASIVNCSWGTSEKDQALYDTMENSDLLFVTSAGNDNMDIGVSYKSPSSFDLSNVITVASIDSNGNLAESSNYGSPVDIAAPGENILSTVPKADSDPGYDGDEYEYLGGTSMAAPQISGVAALIKSQNPTYTASQIISKLKSGAILNTSIKDKVPGGLLVDAYESIKTNSSLTFKKVTSTENSLTIEWNPVTGATRYEVTVFGNNTFYTGSTIYSVSGLTPSKCYTVLVVAKNSSSQTITEKRVIIKTLWLGSGTGLKADYYNDSALNSWELTKNENIDFDWGTGSPDSSINSTNFSAVWQGELEAKYSEECTFYLESRGIAKLWINEQLIASNALDNSDSPQISTGNIILESGKLYPIQVEYYESYSNASIKLSWSSSCQDMEIIPVDRLYPNIGTNGIWTGQGQNADLGAINNTQVIHADGKSYAIVSDPFNYSRVEVYDPTLNKFVHVSDFPNGLEFISGVASLNDVIYGFYLVGSTNTTHVVAFDVKTGTWTSMQGSLPYDIGIRTVISSNGKIYIFGSLTNSNILNYDPLLDQFTTVAQMPDSRENYSLAEFNGKICMSGGSQGATVLKSVYFLDPQNNTWSQGTDMILPRSTHGTITYANKLYAVGGYTTSAIASDKVEVYDPISDKWYPSQNMLTPRLYMGMTVLNGRMASVYGTHDNASYKDFDTFTPKYATTYKITGYVNPDHASSSALVKANFKVEITGSWQYALTDTNGYFEITGVPINTSGYTLKISKDQYLSRPIANAKVRAANLQVGSSTSPVSIWIGDVNKDNAINSFDLNLISSNIYPKYNSMYDMNQDGVINSTDISIWYAHYNTSSSSYPAIF